MPDLADFEDVFTDRVTREVPAPSYESLAARIDGGLTWGVGALVEREIGATLWVREDGTWKLPGGGVEAGETRRAAVRREVREETGIQITVDDLAAVREVTVTDGTREASFYFATYRGTPKSTTVATDPGLADEGIERVAWRESVPDDALDADLVRRIHGSSTAE